MTESGRGTTRGGKAPHGERRAIEYLYVLREHWLSALFVFVLIFGGFVAWTLYATPVYETTATIELEQKGAEQSVLAELSARETPSSVETEMEVMRSYGVARGATEDPEVQLTCLCWEKDAYRTLASLMRRLGRRELPSRLRVRTAEVPQSAMDLELRFDDSAVLTVVDAQGGKPDVRIGPFDPSQPFEAFGHTFTAEVLSGNVAGRTFRLKLQTTSEAASWIHAKRLVALVGRSTGIARISFAAQAPEIARDAVNALARSYLRKRRKDREQSLAGAIEYLEDRVAVFRADVKKAEEDRDTFMREKKAFQLRARASTITRDQTDAKLRQLELQRQLEKETADLERWKAATTFEARLDLSITSSGDSVATKLSTDYATQQRQMEILRSQFQKDHPRYKAALVQLGALRGQLEERLNLTSKNTIAQITRNLEQLNAKLDQTKKELLGYEKEIAAYPEIERELAERDRTVEALRRSLEPVLERQIEVEMSKASDKIPAAMIDEAQLPTARKSPNVAYMLILGFLFGAIASLGMAFMRDALDQKVRSPSELEAELGLTTYAAIPSFTSVGRKARKALKGPIVTRDAPRSVIAEAYRSLRANIRFATSDKQIKTLAITSALAGEGKTITTLNLAIVLAESGSSVVVIDGDMRRSMVHTYMKQERSPGLTEILMGEQSVADVVRPGGVENLSLITAGRRHQHPGTLFDSDAFRSLLETLRESHDYVLVDMPPVLAVADAASFFARLDGVLLLCRARRCPVGVHQGALDQVQRLGGNVLGTIFNGYDARRGTGRGYGYGYGYRGYYGYHAYYAYDERRRRTKKEAPKPAPASDGAS